MNPARVLRSAIVLTPSTLLHLHHLLGKRKYQMLFSTKRGRQPGPKGPCKELVDAVVKMKRRNPRASTADFFFSCGSLNSANALTDLARLDAAALGDEGQIRPNYRRLHLRSLVGGPERDRGTNDNLGQGDC
jgi:hypothetical protein